MPTDKSGKRLPGKAGLYAGEPGAPADAPPMPAGGAPPMAMDQPPMNQAGAEMPPPPGADPMAMGGPGDAQSQMEQMAAAAPAPEGDGFSVKIIKQVADELNEFAKEAMGEGTVPDIMFEEEGNKWPNPLPANIFVPMVAISELGKQMAAGKHDFDPMQIKNDGALRKAAAQIRKMRNDDDFMEQITAEPEAEDEVAEAPPAPGELSGEDEELMAAM